MRTLLFGYGRKIYQSGLHFSLASVSTNLRFGAWLTATVHQSITSTRIYRRWYWREFRRKAAGDIINLAYNVAVVPPAKLNPYHYSRAISGIRQNRGRCQEAARQLL